MCELTELQLFGWFVAEWAEMKSQAKNTYYLSKTTFEHLIKYFEWDFWLYS